MVVADIAVVEKAVISDVVAALGVKKVAANAWLLLFLFFTSDFFPCYCD